MPDEPIDLVAELRSWADYFGSASYDDLDTHLLAAAAEIERLRGIAQRLLSAFPTAQTHAQEKVWQEAYAALQEQPDAG